MNDHAVLFGDELEAVVKWENPTGLSALSGKTIRLRFILNDIDLFALRFAE